MLADPAGDGDDDGAAREAVAEDAGEHEADGAGRAVDEEQRR